MDLEQTQIKNIVQNFLIDSIPDYIIESAQTLISNKELQEIKVKKNETFWTIESTVLSHDLQSYSIEITISLQEETVNCYCNCSNSFSGTCAHAVALLLLFVQEMSPEDEKEASPLSSSYEWRQIFRTFFTTDLEAESGKHYLLFHLYPEKGRLQVAFFRAKQNKSGISNVQTPVTLEQLTQNPDWCETCPELPIVAEQIGHFLDYRGHKVDIPAGLHSWFFRSIEHEYYIYLRDTDIPIRLEHKTMQLKLAPKLSEDGLHFDILLQHEGKKPFSIMHKDVSFYGKLPVWVFLKSAFYPVQTGLSPALIEEIILQDPTIGKNDISEFLDRVWSGISTSDLYKSEDFLKEMEPLFTPANYNPKLFLNEEGSLLTLKIENIYDNEFGEHLLPGPNPDFQTGHCYYEGQSFLIRRAQDEEQHLLLELQDMGFQPRNKKTWFMEQEEALKFLLDYYPMLIEAYRVYGEKNLTRYKVRLTKPEIIAEVTTDEENKWFNLELAVEYDNQRVPIDLIWKAWTQKKRYIQLKDGSYTSLPESWLQKLGDKLRALGYDAEKPPAKQFQQFEAPVLEKILEDIPNASTDSYFIELRDKIQTFETIELLDQPKALQATLRPYQLQGLSYLNFLREYGFGGILADEMGLGKTVQTLSFLQYLFEQKITGPSLIVVPTSVMPNWEREAKKFTPDLQQLVIYGSKREELFKKIPDAQIVITTYALMRRDLEELLKFKYSCVILDEAQNIKNPNTITGKSVRKLDASLRVCLSGTPIENNLFELWSLFEFLMPGFLGSQHSFQRAIVKPIKDGDLDTLESLRVRVKPFILRRTKAEVAKDLPPKIETTHYCDLADDQRELYNALAMKLKKQVLDDVEEKGMAKSQISILDALLKLRQICCHPKLLKIEMPGLHTNIASGKFDAFKDLVLDIIDGGHKVLVFSQFVQMLHIIRSWVTYEKIPFTYLDGSSKDRFEQVDRFNENPDIPIFLISLKAGGTGINLTSADYVIHYDPWWNPAVENQATDRTHRIGQKRQVFAYKMICQNTVEEKILKLQEQKKSVADSIIPGQSAIKSLTKDDLEMLFEI